MTRSLLLLCLAWTLVAGSLGVSAQGRVPTVGVMTIATGPQDPIFAALRQGLREAGYAEGRDIKFEFRSADGQYDRLPVFAEELVQLNVDLVVVGNSVAAKALRRATSKIPIVTVVFDPVAAGLVTNLAHPEGNVTGLSSMATDLSAKRLQLLQETVPRLNRVAILHTVSPSVQSERTVSALKAAAAAMGIDLKFVGAHPAGNFNDALDMIRKQQAQALYVMDSGQFYSNREPIIRLLAKTRLPAIYVTKAFAQAGGLLSYGASNEDQWRRSAGYVDKILKGAKPADLPIEQPSKVELVVNLKTAKALGITIPESILLRADEVIR